MQAGSPRRSKTAHEYVRQSLRTAILGGELVGGARLRQHDLAEQLDVSTTPVREALRDLATEGLVVFDPHRGAVVRPLSRTEVREIYELREVLEPLMVRRVVPVLPADAVQRAAAVQVELDVETDPGTWVDLNRRFHAALAEADQDSRLAQMTSALRDSASAYVSLSLRADPDRLRSAGDEHHALVRAYRDRDVEAAVRLTVTHLRSTLAAIEARPI